MESMRFDSLEPVQVPVTIGSSKFFLLEADESAHIAYNSAVMRGARITEGPDGKPRVENLTEISDTEAVLVSHCLYYATNVSAENPDGMLPLDSDGLPDRTRLVPLARIKAMPGPRLVGKLYARVRDMSGMNAPVRGRPDDKHTCPHCGEVFAVSDEARTEAETARKN